MQKKNSTIKPQDSKDKIKESPLSASEVKNLLLLEIMSPANPKFSPLTSKERHELVKNIRAELPWKEVFLPVRNIDLRNKYTELFEYIDLEIQKENNTK